MLKIPTRTCCGLLFTWDGSREPRLLLYESSMVVGGNLVGIQLVRLTSVAGYRVKIAGTVTILSSCKIALQDRYTVAQSKTVD